MALRTYVGATATRGVFCRLTGKYLSEFGLRLMFRDTKLMVPIRWWVVFLSAFIGTVSHVVLDSIMHFDIEPWYPFSAANHLQGFISFQRCTSSVSTAALRERRSIFWSIMFCRGGAGRWTRSPGESALH